MKNYSISPTDENAATLLQENPIGRNNYIKRFLQLLDAIEENCSIALNGEWGSGKSIFVRQVKLLLDYQNPQYEQPNELKEMIRPVATQFPDCQNQSTVYYDAWANDDHDDPVLSLVYATMTSGQSEYSPEKKEKLGEILASIVDAVTGRPISEALKVAKGTDWLESLKQRDDIHALVRKFLDELILEKANRLVVFIDELDRCRPAFAVQLLERIKHYFDDDRVTFVFSVNLAQLQHTVKGYYGYAFDATRYLDKFFDLRVAAPAVDYTRFLEYKFPFAQTGNVYDKICMKVAEYFSFSLRETERYMRLIRIAAYGVSSEGGLFSEGKARQFARLYIVPIMIGLGMVDAKVYGEFVAGNRTDLLCEILLTSADYINLHWLGVTDKIAPDDISDTIKSQLEKVYDALFGKHNDYSMYNGIRIGEMNFTTQVKRDMLDMVALLASCAEYDFD